MPKQIRVPGHTLPREGRILDKYGYWGVKGPARCTCGWESEELTSDGQRQRAHRQHKLDVLAERGNDV